MLFIERGYAEGRLTHIHTVYSMGLAVSFCGGDSGVVLADRLSFPQMISSPARGGR